MEHPRGRGLKINGASRPHSRNRKWVAGQDNSAHGSDGERWERGGAPRRARGRGRGGGLARGTPHLTVSHPQDEDMSGAEEEGGHSGVDEDDIEAEVEVAVEVEDKDPGTPEERERFYQELVKAREVERKKAIADGKMDDPLVPKRLDEAITMVGTCMDMCPRFERYRRERENNLDRWEVIPGTKRVDHRRAVKIYERAAGDKTLPSDLRPPPVLKKTLDYLFHDLIPRGGFSQTYSFIRDRSRAVRNDFTMQHETGPLAMECHDRCARFHIIALHLERDNAGFSHALEEQQLMNTLQSLKEFYEDQRGRYSSPTELEMRVYHRLIHIRDQRERHDDIPQEILNNPVFQLTTKFRLIVQEKSAPITKVSRLVVDADGMSIFAELAGVLRGQNNVVMIYLVACILERLFGKDAIDDIEAIRGELSISEVIDGVSRPIVDAATPPKHHTTIETRVSPPPQANAVTSVFAPVARPPSSSQSAFSNLASSSSLSAVFGGPTTPSVFGGLTFGIPSSSRSAFPPSTHASQSPFGLTSFPTPPSIQPSSQPALGLAPSSTFQPTPAPPKSVFGPSSTTTQSAFRPTTSSPLNPGASAFVPSRSFPIPVETQPFPGPAMPATNVEKTEPISFLPAAPITTSPVAEQPPRVPTPPEIETPPVNGKLAESRSDSPRPRIVERRQTLWEFPGTPSHLKTPSAESSYNGAPPTPTTPIPVSPNKMPSLGRFEPVALPPTPTARWFEPSSPAQLKLNPSLLLRKQSMGLILQLPDAPAPVEILSPLTLPKTAPQDSLSSTPTRSLENMASTSKLSLDKLSALPSLSSLNKGKEKDKATILDLNSVAHSFLRTSSIVKKHFKLWLKRTIDRAAWDEACRKSEVYSEKVQRHRHSSSVDSSISEMQTVSEVRKRRLSAGVSSSSASARVKRSKHRMSSEYKPPLSDEELARRLKENQEEHQRRWVRGSFLQAVRERVSAATPDGKIPPEWRIWVSANTENDGTAIWLEHKFDIPTSGQWHAENVFSIPVASKGKGPASEGAPGLIVFERTPLGDYPDMIERKYRVLDDCTRLRDALDDIRETKLRFKPSLVVINWSETDGPDAAADFGEMIKELVAEGTVADVTNFVVSAKSTDLDSKFKAALGKMSIDVQDKFISTMSWKRLTEAYLSSLKSFASDWLDSCWVGETLDWSRYGEVIRSLEEAQNMLLEELLALVGGPSGIAIDAPIEFDAPAHMGAAYATGPFLDACVHLPISRAEEFLGSSLRPSYAIPHNELEASARRFETLLQNTSSHLRQLAAASLSSRARQKRRASDESDSGSPSSANKRARLSLSPASSEVEIVDVDADMDDVVEIRTNGHHAAPPSTAPSDTPARAPVTIAMLRALAQGVLNGSKS